MQPDTPFDFHGKKYVCRRLRKRGPNLYWPHHVKSLLPVTRDAMIPDLNATWPDQKSDEVSRDVSHEAMLADPEGLARALMATV